MKRCKVWHQDIKRGKKWVKVRNLCVPSKFSGYPHEIACCKYNICHANFRITRKQKPIINRQKIKIKLPMHTITEDHQTTTEEIKKVRKEESIYKTTGKQLTNGCSKFFFINDYFKCT